MGEILGLLAHIFADSSKKKMKNDPFLAQFILDPIQKDEFWRIFKREYADKSKIQKK